MSEQGFHIPQWTPADRFRKARVDAKLSQAELAALIDITENTVSNYETGATTNLRRSVVNRWALVTKVPAEWLRFGIEPPNPHSGGGSGSDHGGDLPGRDSGWIATVMHLPQAM